MVRRIQTLNYQCLRHVDVRLDGNFHILVGPNASGKSTLIDVIAFLADAAFSNIEGVVQQRAPDFRDLVWGRRGKNLRFELALELDAEAVSESAPLEEIHRYELAVRDGGGDGPCIEIVRGLDVSSSAYEPRLISRFPEPLTPVRSILSDGREQDTRVLFSYSFSYSKEFPDILGRLRELLNNFDPERAAAGDLDSLLEHAIAVKAMMEFDLLRGKVKRLILDNHKLHAASPPTHLRTCLSSDGANLPWAAHHLKEKNEAGFRNWIDHVRTVLPELKDIHVVQREEDHHAYLMLSYGSGIEVPSWVVSEGTLRLLALTLIAYLPDVGKIYLIEEPENGIHPLAIEAVYQSLSSVYGSHVFITTHSPTLLGCAQPREVLCFARDQEGATDVVSGTDHPRLEEWLRTADMNLLFAPDVFG